jgi:tetratricopeptide (TPR) repeat protein
MYDHVTRLEPGYAEGWLASGRIAAQFEDWAYALETLNTALTLEPRRYDAYLTLGHVLEQAQEYRGALDAYEAALEIYPAHERAREARDRIASRLAGRPL